MLKRLETIEGYKVLPTKLFTEIIIEHEECSSICSF